MDLAKGYQDYYSQRFEKSPQPERALAIFRERNQLAADSPNVDPIDVYDATLQARRVMTEADVNSGDRLRYARQVARVRTGPGEAIYPVAHNPFNRLMSSENS